MDKYVYEIVGDVTELHGWDCIIHCANCFNTMGSGVAKTIREVIPEAYEADCRTERGDKNKFGGISVGWMNNHYKNDKLTNHLTRGCVINLYGQYTFGGYREVNYEALYTGFERAYQFAEGENLVVGIPKYMACDRAGGSWVIVESMIKHFAESYKVKTIIVEYKG